MNLTGYQARDFLLKFEGFSLPGKRAGNVSTHLSLKSYPFKASLQENFIYFSKKVIYFTSVQFTISAFVLFVRLFFFFRANTISFPALLKAELFIFKAKNTIKIKIKLN